MAELTQLVEEFELEPSDVELKVIGREFIHWVQGQEQSLAQSKKTTQPQLVRPTRRPEKRGHESFFFYINKLQYHVQHYNSNVHVQYKNKIFLSVQVKNKPRDGGTKHAFILGSVVCTVANRTV
jgi:hypothetical protein